MSSQFVPMEGDVPIKSYRDLRVWQAGMDLVVKVYELSEQFPSKEIYVLANQMRRAAISIPSNIAEGHTRNSTKEYLHHLSIAQASLAELETQIEIAFRLMYCSQEQMQLMLEQIISLGKQLYALRNALLQPGTGIKEQGPEYTLGEDDQNA